MTNANQRKKNLTFAFGLLIGIAMSLGAAGVMAAKKGPTEHNGISVDMLGAVPATSIQKMIGLEGYTLRIRAATIEPGGHIARHTHPDRPVVAAVIAGEWVEVTETDERRFDDSLTKALVEDEHTDHWIVNRGNVPAKAIVCDIAKAN